MLQECSGREAQFQCCKDEEGTGSQGARWVGASPVFCNCRVATDFCPELPPPSLAACPWAVHPVKKFLLLKVTPDSTCGRRWELLGTVALWHTDQHSEELRHRADKVRHGCERCWEWKYQSEFVQSVWILTLIKRGKHKAAPPRLSPTSSAENSFHRACNSYCAPTSPEVEHVAASFICPVHHLMSPR